MSENEYREQAAGISIFLQLQRDLMEDARVFAAEYAKDPTAVANSARVDYYTIRLDDVMSLLGKSVEEIKKKMIYWATATKQKDPLVFKGLQEYLRSIFRNSGIEI